MDRDTLIGFAALVVFVTSARLSGVPWWWIVGTLAVGIVSLIGWAIWMEITERE